MERGAARARADRRYITGLNLKGRRVLVTQAYLGAGIHEYFYLARAVLRGRRSPAAFAGALGAEEISRVFAGGLSRPFVQRPLLRVERLLPGDGVDLRRLAGHQSFAAGASCLAVLLGDLEPALAARLRALIRNARKDAALAPEQRHGRAWRELFQFIKPLLFANFNKL